MNPYTNFTAVRGKPLTVLIAMILLGGYAYYHELEEWCDYSRPTLRKAMKPLLRLGYIKPVTQSRFMINDYTEQTQMFAEKFFQVDSSSINIKESIDILSIESTTTTRCKIFTASPDVEKYLKSKGVWVRAIPEIAELVNNDMTFLKAHFEGVDTALAIHRIKSGIPSIETKFKICNDCFVYPCECIND